MPASKTEVRVRFKVESAHAIAVKRGFATLAELADYLNVTASNYSRVHNGVTDPGKDFIAQVLASHPDDPDVSWDGLFEVVGV